MVQDLISVSEKISIVKIDYNKYRDMCRALWKMAMITGNKRIEGCYSKELSGYSENDEVPFYRHSESFCKKRGVIIRISIHDIVDLFDRYPNIDEHVCIQGELFMLRTLRKILNRMEDVIHSDLAELRASMITPSFKLPELTEEQLETIKKFQPDWDALKKQMIERGELKEEKMEDMVEEEKDDVSSV